MHLPSIMEFIAVSALPRVLLCYANSIKPRFSAIHSFQPLKFPMRPIKTLVEQEYPNWIRSEASYKSAQILLKRFAAGKFCREMKETGCADTQTAVPSYSKRRTSVVDWLYHKSKENISWIEKTNL